MKAKIIWLTGLPGSGKTTIAREYAKNFPAPIEVLDGDELREMFPGTGFLRADRIAHCKRVALMARKLADHGVWVVVALVSPYHEIHGNSQKICGTSLVQVYVDCSLEECERRDPKGLYAKARAGEIKNFTRISDPFEIPVRPDIVLDTEDESLKVCVDQLPYPDTKPRALFIGRWQPFHKGHEWLIRQKLITGVGALVAVRDIPPDRKNPYTTEQTCKMIEAAFVYDDVQVIRIPDIESVNYGRGVGYEVNGWAPPGDVYGISATEIRNRMASGDDTWKQAVNPGVADWLIETHKEPSQK